MDVRTAVSAIVVFAWGLFAAIVGWYIVPILLDTMSDIGLITDTSDVLFKSIFWGGLIFIFAGLMIYMPIVALSSGKTIQKDK